MLNLSPDKIPVLVGCEFSQVIMREFLAMGFDAYSCDILPCEGPFPDRHLQMDIFQAIELKPWKLGIFHPPCTYLSYAATAYWNQPGRMFKRIEALQFFASLWNAPLSHICIENPLGIADTVIEKHTQMIHPWYFGDPYMKKTCLWLKNLPSLQYSFLPDLFSSPTACNPPEPVYLDHQSGRKRHFTDSICGSRNGGHKRSVSFPSIAKAMALQWAPVLLHHA